MGVSRFIYTSVERGGTVARNAGGRAGVPLSLSLSLPLEIGRDFLRKTRSGVLFDEVRGLFAGVVVVDVGRLGGFDEGALEGVVARAAPRRPLELG